MLKQIAFLFVLIVSSVAFAENLKFTKLEKISQPIMLGNNATMECTPGAGVVREAGSPEFHMVQVTGDHVVIRGCIIDSNSGPGSNILVTGAHVLIEHNRILNSIHALGSVVLWSAKSATIRDNYLTEVAGGDPAGQIYGENSVTDALIENNEVINSSGKIGTHGIAFHEVAPGSVMARIKIRGNTITAAGGFCVEVGNFGPANASVPLEDVEISGNTCKLAADGHGGYSVLLIRKLLVDHNVFHANGFHSQIAPIEIHKTQGTITNNTADMEGLGYGATCERCFSSVWTNNVITGINAQNKNAYGLHVEVSPGVGISDADGTSASDNRFEDNRFEFAPGQRGIGIWQQCNQKTARCVNNTYIHNTIVSAPSPRIYGIVLQNDGGESSNTRVVNNVFNGSKTEPVTRGRVKGTVTQ